MAKMMKKTAKRGPKPKSEKLSVTAKMLRVILRKKRESLGDACRAAGMAPANYYYHLRNVKFGEGKRGKKSKTSMSSLEAKRLATLVKRQERLQRELQKLCGRILSC